MSNGIAAFIALIISGVGVMLSGRTPSIFSVSSSNAKTTLLLSKRPKIDLPFNNSANSLITTRLIL